MSLSRRWFNHWEVPPLLLDFTINWNFHEGWKGEVDVIANHSMESTAFDTIKRHYGICYNEHFYKYF